MHQDLNCLIMVLVHDLHVTPIIYSLLLDHSIRQFANEMASLANRDGYSFRTSGAKPDLFSLSKLFPAIRIKITIRFS